MDGNIYGNINGNVMGSINGDITGAINCDIIGNTTILLLMVILLVM